MIRLSRLLFAAAFFAVGCSGTDAPPPGPDASTKPACETFFCGGACCGDGQVCFKDACCSPQSCSGRECGSDGCGEVCGVCGTGQVCNTETYKCESCTVETDAAFCARMGKECGPAEGVDNCGFDRVVSECGPCANGKGCAPAGTCTGTCVPWTSRELCLQGGKNCGAYVAVDNCGFRRNENCGLCTTGQDCIDNVCQGCLREDPDSFCGRVAAADGRNCGVIADLDNCLDPRTVDCGYTACGAEQICNEELNRCEDCTPETDAELCAAADKQCGGYSTVDRCHFTRDLDCGNCASPTQCRNNYCAIPGGQTNDSCAQPEALTFKNGVAVVAGDNTNAKNDYQGTCGGEGNDLVYLLTIPGTQARSVIAKVTRSTAGGNLQPAVYIRSACGASAAAAERACDATTGTTATTKVNYLEPGAYYVFVDATTASSAGSFTLEVTLGQATLPPANDTCATATALSFTAGGTASVNGTTLGANNDTRGTCSATATPHTGGDVFYSFTVPSGSPKSVALRVVRDPTAASFKPVVYLRSVCDSPALDDEPGCAPNVLATGDSTLLIPKLLPGDYFVVVDGESLSEGGFNLQVTLGNPLNVPDTCATAEKMVFDASGRGSATNDTALALAHVKPSCETATAGSGKDTVYLVDTAGMGMRKLTAKLTFQASAADAVLSVRTACASTAAADQLGCVKSTTNVANLVLNAIPEGKYYVHVDQTAGGEGLYSLEVTLGAPLLGDTCAYPQALTFSAEGVATFASDTTTADNTGKGSCYSSSNGDLVYSFSTTTPKVFEATVTPEAGSGLRPYVYLRKQNCDSTLASDEVGCKHTTAANTAVSLLVESLAPGDYYLWVDGYSSTYKGPFQLLATLTDPPTNNECSKAVDLGRIDQSSTRLRGITIGATNESAGSCSAMPGSDVVYKFELLADASVTVKASPEGSPSFQPAVYVLGNCPGTAADEKACNKASAAGAPAQATVVTLPPGVYYVVVDSVTATGGRFALDVTADYPIVVPDDCARAELLSFAGGSITLNGDTSLGTQSGDGTCNTSSGADLVYTFTTGAVPQTLQVAVAADPGSALRPSVYLRKECANAAAAQQVACNLAASSAVPAALTAAALTPNTQYWLWVDSHSATAKGPFTLRAQLTDVPAAPGNDLCAGAEDLGTIDHATRSVVGSTAGAAGEWTASCGTFDGADVLYKFTLAAEGSVAVKVTPEPGAVAFAPGVAIVSACAPAAAGEKKCGKAAMPGAAATASIDKLPAGSYFVVVDGQGGGQGGFTLEVAADDPIVFPDTCAVAQTLKGFDANGNGTVTVESDTTLAAADYRGTCMTADAGMDLVYKLVVPPGKTKEVSATMTFNTGSTSDWANVYIRKDNCTSALAADEVACTKTSNNTAVATASKLTEGSYYIFVDSSYSSDYGPFALVVNVSDTPPPPANDVCATADDLGVLAVGTTVPMSGDTSWARNDYTASCSAGTGGDVVFTFELAAPAAVTAKVIPGASATAFKPVVSIRTACPGAAADDRACATGAAAATTIASAAELPAGSYWIVVDGEGATAGAFNLEITVDAAATTPEDCSATELLSGFDPDGNGMVTVSGDTSTALNDASGTCKTTSGPELVYAFDVAAGQEKELTAELTFAAGTNGALLYVRKDVCTSSFAADQLACAEGTTTSLNVAAISLHKLGPGRYFLFADSTASTYMGPFDLVVTLEDTPAPGAHDVCAAPIQLNAGTPIDGSTVTVTGETWSATHDYSGACATPAAPMDGRDVVYAFTLSAPQKVTAKVVPQGSPAYKPALFLRTACPGLPADELACAVATTGGGTATANAANLPAGTHYLVVDGLSGTSGDFQLEVTAAAPGALANDDCSSPELITGFDPQGNGTVTVSGDTTTALHDVAGTCKSTIAASDLVYALDLPAGAGIKDVTAKMVFTSTSNYATVFIRKACTSADPADEVACTSTSTATAIAKAKALPAGRYFIFADSSYATDKGPFTLEVTVIDTPPIPLNDVCSAVTPGSNFDLSPELDATGQALVFGDTDPAVNDYSGTCNSTTGMTGSDVAYTFTLAAESSVVAQLLPDGRSSTWDPALYLRANCASPTAADEKACQKNTTAISTGFVAATLPAGSYYLVVDGLTGSAGKYALDVSMGPPLTAPANDACTAPLDLGVYDGTPLTVSGLVTAAADSGKGTCTSSTSGPDVVYQFTTGATVAPVRVVLQATTPDMKPLVYVRSSCADTTAAAQVGCKYQSTFSGLTSALLSTLTPNTQYFVWADGYDATKGGYLLALMPDPTPTNDTCANELELQRGVPAFGNTSAAVADYGTTISAACFSALDNDEAAGKDLVFSYTPTASGPFVVEVTPEAWDVSVWYATTSCGDDAACVSGTDAGGSGIKEVLTIDGVAGTTYHLVVDSYSTTAGGMFSIVVR